MNFISMRSFFADNESFFRNLPVWTVNYYKKKADRLEWDSEDDRDLWIADNANKDRVESIIEELGFKHTGSSEISMSSYYTLAWEDESVLDEFGLPETKELRFRISDHSDRHPDEDTYTIGVQHGNYIGDLNFSFFDDTDEIKFKIKEFIKEHL